jgi:hypothetical protein
MTTSIQSFKVQPNNSALPSKNVHVQFAGQKKENGYLSNLCALAKDPPLFKNPESSFWPEQPTFAGVPKFQGTKKPEKVRSLCVLA